MIIVVVIYPYITLKVAQRRQNIFQRRWATWNMLYEDRLQQLKSILFKNILTKSNSLVNLHDSAPIFQANMHQNAGQKRANLLGYWIWQVCS